MNDKLSYEQLENVVGGQYDPDVTYTNTYALRNGNLYSISNIKEIVGSITAGQALQLHPDFLYKCDGAFLCIVRIDGTDYVTERDNIAMK